VCLQIQAHDGRFLQTASSRQHAPTTSNMPVRLAPPAPVLLQNDIYSTIVSSPADDIATLRSTVLYGDSRFGLSTSIHSSSSEIQEVGYNVAPPVSLEASLYATDDGDCCYAVDLQNGSKVFLPPGRCVNLNMYMNMYGYVHEYAWICTRICI
jgi:hypothetical protein